MQKFFTSARTKVTGTMISVTVGNKPVFTKQGITALGNIVEQLKALEKKVPVLNEEEHSDYSLRMLKQSINFLEEIIENNTVAFFIENRDSLFRFINFIDSQNGTYAPVVFDTVSKEIAQIVLKIFKPQDNYFELAELVYKDVFAHLNKFVSVGIETSYESMLTNTQYRIDLFEMIQNMHEFYLYKKGLQRELQAEFPRKDRRQLDDGDTPCHQSNEESEEDQRITTSEKWESYVHAKFLELMNHHFPAFICTQLPIEDYDPTQPIHLRKPLPENNLYFNKGLSSLLRLLLREEQYLVENQLIQTTPIKAAIGKLINYDEIVNYMNICQQNILSVLKEIKDYLNEGNGDAKKMKIMKDLFSNIQAEIKKTYGSSESPEWTNVLLNTVSLVNIALQEHTSFLKENPTFSAGRCGKILLEARGTLLNLLTALS